MTRQLIEHIVEFLAAAAALRAVYVYRNPFRRVGRRREVRRLGARHVHSVRSVVRAIWRSR